MESSVSDVSQLAASRLLLENEDVDLAELVRGVTDRLQESAARAGCEIRLAVPDALRGRWDRARLEQVGSNLISNAVKYGDGKPIEIALERSKDRARLSVTDGGIGIARSDQARIFERFERVASPRRDPGFGVGLWLARTLVESMRGRIDVASEPRCGSTFTVDVPIAPP